MTRRAGHSTVSPYLMAFDAPALIHFLEKVFGAEVLLRQERDDGTLMHAAVRIVDSVVMIAEGTDQYPAFPVWLHVYVDDVDAVFAAALSEGAVTVQKPVNHADGDRRAGVRDHAGNIWWIASVNA